MASTWDEWHLRARETAATLTMGVNRGEDPVPAARKYFKINRVGEKGMSPSSNKPTDLPERVRDVRAWTEKRPTVDFITRDPLDWTGSPVKVMASIDEPRMTSPEAEAAIVTHLVDWARSQSYTLVEVQLDHETTETRVTDQFTVRGAALTDPELAGRLAGAKAAGPVLRVADVDYSERGHDPSTGQTPLIRTTMTSR